MVLYGITKGKQAGRGREAASARHDRREQARANGMAMQLRRGEEGRGARRAHRAGCPAARDGTGSETRQCVSMMVQRARDGDGCKANSTRERFPQRSLQEHGCGRVAKTAEPGDGGDYQGVVAGKVAEALNLVGGGKAQAKGGAGGLGRRSGCTRGEAPARGGHLRP